MSPSRVKKTSSHTDLHHRLAAIEGEWHEFESKALRKENERKDKEARRQAQKDAVKADKEKKRGPESEVSEREPKRVHVI